MLWQFSLGGRGEQHSVPAGQVYIPTMAGPLAAIRCISPSSCEKRSSASWRADALALTSANRDWTLCNQGRKFYKRVSENDTRTTILNDFKFEAVCTLWYSASFCPSLLVSCVMLLSRAFNASSNPLMRSSYDILIRGTSWVPLLRGPV